MSKFGLMLLASASVFGSTAALAQAAQGSAPDNRGLQDIVVTAQRRAQNLLTVPLSISAATGAELNSSGIREISSLSQTTPGFITENGTGYEQIYIRGVGNNISVGADPSVATYIDDVPRIYGSMINNFFNVERVEVLKGAQGGLYGRNATGGVVNIITKQPSDKPAAEARVSYGSKNTLSAAAYVNVPITDHIAWNISVERDQHSPYIRNLVKTRTPYTAAMFPSGSTSPKVCGFTGCSFSPQQTADFFNSAVNPPSGLGNQNFWAIDSKLRLQFADNFKITLDGDYAKKHDSEGDQWNQASPNQLQTEVSTVFFPLIAGTTVNLPPNFFKTGGKFTVYSSVPAFANLVDYGGSAKAELRLPGVELTSITAYRAQHTLYDNDSGASVAPIVIPDVQNHKWYFYQELRAVSTGTGPFHFLGGVTYLRDHFHGLTVITDFGLPSFAGKPTESTDDVRNWSVYGQVGYDFTDRLNLTLSGRYIHEKNEALFTEPQISSATIVAHKFLPSATLTYKIGDGILYARYAKGFKAGGVNPVVAPVLFNGGPGSTFGPEQIDTYEVGYRGAWFDHKVQLTSALFYNKYKGLQYVSGGDRFHPSLIEAIINVGSARMWGAEGSLTWRVARPLTLGITAGYLNAKYQNFALTGQAASIAGLQAFDYSGQRMIFSPSLQVALTANLDLPLDDRLRLVGNWLTSHVSDIVMSKSAVLPDPVQPGYWLTNVRIGVRTADDRYGLYLYVNNLFNKYYTTFGSTGVLGSSFVEGDPRIIGGEIQIKF